MPILKQAKKRVKQAAKRQARNYNVRSTLRKSIRAINDAIKAGKKKDAEGLLPKVYKVIDTAVKKSILQKNTAARRKSLLARKIAGMKG